MSTETVKKAPREGGVFLAILKFVPLFLFAGLVVFAGMDLLLASPIACLCAVVVSMYVNRCNFTEGFEYAVKSAASIVIVFFILMFAYAVAECFMATGVGAALIQLALSAGVTAKTVSVVAFLLTCCLSLATGTSWGTFASCAPIFLWLNHILGGNPYLVIGAIAGGSCFGDNIGFISDTTVLSCGYQDVKIIDRVKHQSIWSVLCIALSCVCFFALSMSLPSAQGDLTTALSNIPPEAIAALEVERPSALTLIEQVQVDVPVYMIIPFLLVIITSFLGWHTLICLGSGIVSALILGMAAGMTDLASWLDLCLTGFGDAGSWSIVMMCWVAGFGGVMNSMNAFEPLSKLCVKLSKNIHHLLGWCGVLCIIGNTALSDEAAEIATFSPIVRGIIEDSVAEDTAEEDLYKLRVRLATYTDALGVYGSMLIPWHCYPVFYLAIAQGVYPIIEWQIFDIMKFNFMSFFCVGTIIILSFTGLDKLIPLFGVPEVKLKGQK